MAGLTGYVQTGNGKSTTFLSPFFGARCLRFRLVALATECADWNGFRVVAERSPSADGGVRVKGAMVQRGRPGARERFIASQPN